MKKIMAMLTSLTVALLLLQGCVSAPPADSRPPVLKEPSYGSERPLYFRVVFGKEGKTSMLGVIDESNGTGTGYNVAYVDENFNNDFTDDEPKRFKPGREKGEWDPRFYFKGPAGEDESARYMLDIYSLASKKRKATQGNNYTFFWGLRTKGWNYWFINGRLELFLSAADARKGAPVRLGGGCKWEISSLIDQNKVFISAGLKDENGSTLRVVSSQKKELSPVLTLVNGAFKQTEKMEFG